MSHSHFFCIVSVIRSCHVTSCHQPVGIATENVRDSLENSICKNGELTRDTMILFSDKLFVFYFCFIFIHCAFGFFDDNRIEPICRLKCDFNLMSDGDSFFCDRDCQVEQCNTGCSLYEEAVSSAPCPSVCTAWMYQNMTEQEQGNSVTQIKKQSCIQGCSFALEEYYNLIVPYTGLDLAGPEVAKDNITHNSVVLFWSWNHTHDDVTFILQRRVVDTNTEWQIHNYTEALPSGSYNVTHLLPYLTYKFKMIIKVTTVHAVETDESVPVTTLPYGVPASSPTITSLRAPSSTVVSVSWTPPIYTNGPLISYRLSLHPLDSSDHVISKDCSPNASSWIFGHLPAGQKYEVRVSAVNSEGEGPAHVMTVTTPTPGNLSEKEMPFLVLGAENMVVKQRLLELTREAEKILTKPKSILITDGATVLFQSNSSSDLIQGVGVHVGKELVLVSDDSGRVTLINVSGDTENGDIYPTLIQPTAINVDWLNDHAYIADGHRIYQCTIKQMGNQCKIAMDLTPLQPREVKVDPINGYLYYTILDSKKGLHRVDLGDFMSSNEPKPNILIHSDLRTFFIDHENLLLYFPNNSQNTIMSAYLDGTGLTDMRQGTVARPHFTNIESIIFYDDKFFWTNGTKVFSEEYDTGNRTYYHNSLLLFEKHFRGFNMYYPGAQPMPAPVSPPSRLQVLFTAFKAIIEWQVPDQLTFQGNGAYNKWDYEVNILQDDGTNDQVHQTAKQMNLVVSNLAPDTRYRVRVRAKSSSGTGPWSDVFYGRTLKDGFDSAKLIVAVQHHEYKMWRIKEVGMDGQTPKTLVDTSMLYPGVTDLAWYDDKLFWTTDGGNLFMYRGDASETMPLEFVTDAACVMFDWLGQRLYWSMKKHGVIKRADLFGNNVDFVYQALAKDMTLDSVKGRLYWVTLNTVETTYLDGTNHMVYFSVPYFSGKHIISLSVDPDLKKLIWYVKGFEDQSLYMADLLGYHGDSNDVISNVELVANFQDVATFSPLQYFSHRLFWLDSESLLTVGDTQCNFTSTMSAIGAPVTMFALRHPSLYQYPEKLNSSTVRVIPGAIQPDTISCQGVWSHFNITWQPSVEVNHGEVSYELSVQADGMAKIVLVTDPWYALSGLSPYTPVTVSVRGFTYWGSGPMTTTTVKSPMAAPSQPQAPKVYVTQRKNAASSKLTLAADFRWSEPEQINGFLNKQNVYYWESSPPKMVSSTGLVPSARHFILDGLKGNITYFFEVESCTQAGCGPRSQVANATADAVNPIPKLLIAMTDTILVAEADNVKNTSVTIATKSVVAMGYLAQDETYYWVTRDRYLEQFPASTNERLVQLEGEGQAITLDWISRTLYIVEGNSVSARIISYKIDQSTHNILVQRNTKIGHVVVDPYTSTLLWSEKDKGDNSWKMISSSTDGSNITEHFVASHRRRRSVNNVCNCPASQRVSAAMAMDLSKDGHTEVIFVDEGTNSLMAADIDGCSCRILLTTTPSDRKGLPADYMTVDHVYIYWYQKSSQTLHTMDKATGKLSSFPVPGVLDILAFGAHLHPLPGSECLDTTPYTDKVDIESYSNTSATVSLQEVSWPESCGRISHPATKYTVFYRKLDDMNPKDDCSPTGQQCMFKAAYSREITLEGLEPYTYYIIQGAVSNYYSAYSATSLGEAITVRTKPGVPSAVTNITAMPQSPNNITVSWPPPFQPNGPLDKIVYFIKWSTSVDGISHALMTEAITYDAIDPYDNGLFMVGIGMLTADQTYSVQVICNQTEGNFVTESVPVKVHTFQEPEDLELMDITNTSIHLSWQSPSDDSTSMVSIYYAEVISGVPGNFTNKVDDLPMLTSNYTLYNETFNNLKPNTEYTFRLNIIYRFGNYKVYHWPKDSMEMKYVFKTLTGIPGQPDPPVVEEIKSGEFEISWTVPLDHGEKITHYILEYRLIDKDNWTLAFNTSDLRWVVDESILQRGYTYMFRVMAENKNGWGTFSLNSSLFSYPILEAKSEDSMVTMVAVVCAFVLVVIAMAVIAICYSCCKRRKEEKKKKKNMEFTAVSRGPDMELATLRELPMTAIQQNNTLYAMNLVPTDDEIAALPHFRRDQLVLCKFLGSGAFGEVFEGIAKNILNESSGDTKCAVKTLRKSASDQEKEEFLKEALLMSNFHQEHILSLLGVCLDNDPQFIILELMEGSDLLSFMRACRLSSIQNRSELSLADLVKICVHVSRGCKYLEDMHFVHRDLAARNCLVSSCNPATMVVKIGDFGLARDIYKNDYYRKEGEGLLPVRWMSPESLVDGVFTTQSDIWAFGVLMWEVVTFGQQPYPARTNIEVLHFVRTGGRLDRPDNCPDDFYQLMCKCWSFAPEDRPSFAYLLQQLEKFQETCASISEYLVPIRSNNGPIAAVGGYKYLTPRSRRVTTSTSSDGPESVDVAHIGYGSHKSYGTIRRATSFDAPEPKDATQQIRTDASNYLEPRSRCPPSYMEFLPDSKTENYMYNSKGERVRENANIPTESHSLPRGPSYVQTTVKENIYPFSAEYMKHMQQKSSSGFDEGSDGDVYRKFSHQKSSADSVIMKTVENIPDSVNGSTKATDNSSNIACSDSSKYPENNVTYAQVMYGIAKKSNHFRKHRLDSSNSIMSFDSVQTEPAYCENPNHRNKLYSSSSSKSNYSMSNISEQIPEHVDSQPRIDEECQQFWANNTSANAKGQNEVKGHVDYLNLGRRSQVYPENAGVLAGYDIVHASLV